MRTSLSVLLAAAMLAGCPGDEPPPPEPKAPEGRAETRNIRNTDAVGYGGGAIADKVDKGLNAQEQANRERQAAEEQQTSGD